jgi:hypothetical protein
MDRSVDPDVRQMWRDIAEQYEYLAEHVPQQEESHKAVQWPYNGPGASPRGRHQQVPKAHPESPESIVGHPVG